VSHPSQLDYVDIIYGLHTVQAEYSICWRGSVFHLAAIHLCLSYLFSYGTLIKKPRAVSPAPDRESRATPSKKNWLFFSEDIIGHPRRCPRPALRAVGLDDERLIVINRPRSNNEKVTERRDPHTSKFLPTRTRTTDLNDWRRRSR
jgi:hypothetical protein